jgi:ADP-ribose pyrophosphatase
MTNASMILQPWRVLRSTVAYNHRIQVLEDRVSTPDGDEFVCIYAKSTHDLVAVLALTDEREVLLAYEYRQPQRRMIYNLPSGSIPEGEIPSQAARRELAEETGYTAHTLTPLGRMTPLPSVLAGTIHLFLARGLVRTAPHLDQHEYITIVPMDAGEALQRMLRDEFEDGALQMALLLADQQRLLDAEQRDSGGRP